MSENINKAEIHGCIVCARLFNVLAVYTPDDTLVDSSVTSSGGHCVPDDDQPLVACNSHTPDEIDAAHKRWQSRNERELAEEQEDE
ncbi:MAG: hypothetical protein HQ525_00500 [Anaerolineae bacterium]|nr:hypothetical protein [Anaerolineae bacterium]